MDWVQKLENYHTVRREVAELTEVVKSHSGMYNREKKIILKKKFSVSSCQEGALKLRWYTG
jgi:glucosamine 6-phosphate synthetase-like amidotransferase/phosphosugar isomerase protein